MDYFLEKTNVLETLHIWPDDDSSNCEFMSFAKNPNQPTVKFKDNGIGHKS